MKYKDKNYFDDDVTLGALLFIFHKNQHKYLNECLANYGLNIMQALFLLRIHYSDDFLSQKDLAEIFYLTKGSVAKSLRKLEDKNLILRERLNDDRRQYHLKLTEEGQKLIPKIKNINKTWEEHMELDKLDSSFMEILKDLTSKSIQLNELV